MAIPCRCKILQHLHINGFVYYVHWVSFVVDGGLKKGRSEISNQ
jgi:hypothetical protein